MLSSDCKLHRSGSNASDVAWEPVWKLGPAFPLPCISLPSYRSHDLKTPLPFFRHGRYFWRWVEFSQAPTDLWECCSVCWYGLQILFWNCHSHVNLLCTTEHCFKKIIVVHLLSRIWLFATPWTPALPLPCPSPSPRVCSIKNHYLLKSLLDSDFLHFPLMSLILFQGPLQDTTLYLTVMTP